MREIECTIEGEEHAALVAALAEGRDREDTLWSKEIDVGNGLVVDLKLCGSGRGHEPWVDVVLFEKTEGGLVEVSALDVQDSPYGEFAFPDEGFVLKVADGASLAPSP